MEAGRRLTSAGDVASESGHGFLGSDTQSGTVSGRSWRHAKQKGSFGYTLATGGREDLALVCVVGARDRDRQFDVYVGDTKLASPDLRGEAPGLVRVLTLPISAELARGRSSLTVRFQSRGAGDSATASVFECMLVPANPSET